ncbi:hypothetical protein [Streptomyces milbemycinicus]|uniref:Uncharacterized protein n=1 Tax=Streptomyces milbemycinicus TaxID=476552 RepID=A0ABW8LRN0_9ACTN
MRTRLMLASAAMGALLLTGGAVATAQAAPASLDPGNTTAAATIADSWVYVGTYSSYAACVAEGENYIGTYTCTPTSRGRYDLYVLV